MPCKNCAAKWKRNSGKVIYPKSRVTDAAFCLSAIHFCKETMIAKTFLAIAAINGLLAVALGAFGAHGLKGRLTESLMSAYQTAVQYHFYHTLALLGLAILMQRVGKKALLMTSGYLFIAGMVLFSGSLYWMAFGGPRWLGPVTPLGGLTFLAGWLLLFIAALRS